MMPAVILLQPLLPETERLVDIGLRVGLAIVAGFLFQRLLFLVVGRGEKWIVRVGRGSEHARQRSRTVGSIFRSLVTGLVAGAVVIYILEVMGWDVRPLLGGAAVLGVALGFGAQTLVRDVIAGVFILAEDQFGVGDLIEVNGLAGTVEGLTVRSTTLRDFHGYLHFVPNGEMKVVVNRSRGWNRVAVDVPIAADENVDSALDVCRRVAAALSSEPGWRPRLLDEIQVWGVEALGGQEVQIRLVVRATPGPNAHEAARELRRRLHRALVEAGLRLGLQREIGITAVGPPEETVRGTKAS